MKFYLQEFGDPMIIGTIIELNELAEKLHQFVRSTEDELVIPSSTLENPLHYPGLLQSLKLTKRESPIMISVQSNKELWVVGSAENLTFWVSHFRFPNTAQDGDHHHPESYSREGYIQTGSLSTIIEIENAENDI
jgi:hypothetical protein